MAQIAQRKPHKYPAPPWSVSDGGTSVCYLHSNEHHSPGGPNSAPGGVLLSERICTQNSADPDSGTGRASKCPEHPILCYGKASRARKWVGRRDFFTDPPKSHKKISRRFKKFRREKHCDEYLMLSEASISTNEPQSLQEDQLMPWLLSFPGSFLQAHRVSMYIYLFVVISYPGRSRIMNCVRQGRWIWDTREQHSKEIKVLLLLGFFPPWSVVTARPSSVKNVSERDNHRKLNKASGEASSTIHHWVPGNFQPSVSLPAIHINVCNIFCAVVVEHTLSIWMFLWKNIYTQNM